jgi:hypothetical protein
MKKKKKTTVWDIRKQRGVKKGKRNLWNDCHTPSLDCDPADRHREIPTANKVPKSV